MQCNAMQCNAMQCNAMQCNAMQCNAMQCNAMQCNAMQCNAMQCNAMQCNAMQCNAMQCNASYILFICFLYCSYGLEYAISWLSHNFTFSQFDKKENATLNFERVLDNEIRFASVQG